LTTIINALPSRSELENDKGKFPNPDSLSENFEEIKISVHHILIDPIVSLIFSPFKFCFKHMGCFQRPKILKKCHDKFTKELEITSLINKLRDTNGMLSGLLTPELKGMIKFT